MYHKCICGDCFEQFETMKDNSVDMILTDIPYDGEVMGFVEGGFQRVNRDGADMRGFDTERFVRECIRVCSGTFIIFCGNKQMGIIRSIFDSMRPKLQMFRTINWEKTNVSPMNGQYFFLNSNEFAAAFRKPRAYWSGHCVHTNFVCRTRPLKWHPTSKPVELLQKFIQLGCPPNGTVFDPVSGSFSTTIAAALAGRNSIGVEINKEYFDKAMERISSCGIVPDIRLPLEL